MQELADQHQLCYSLLGMERLTGRRGCFRSMLSLCAGACCGKESREVHDQRLRAGLQEMQVHCWPYPGAVGLEERWENWTQLHVIHHWCYLGSAANVEQAQGLTTQASGFDAHGYKILCQPLLDGQHELIPLWH